MIYATIIDIKTINPVILFFKNNNVPHYFFIKNSINPHILSCKQIKCFPGNSWLGKIVIGVVGHDMITHNDNAGLVVAICVKKN